MPAERGNVARGIGLVRRFEKIISLVAVIGVLLHAGLLVHHNAMMLDTALDRVALDFAGGVICHSDGDAAQPGSGLPDPSGKLPPCPDCLGAAMGAAILPPTLALPVVAPHEQRRPAYVSQEIGQRSTAPCPPSRAPPRAI